MSFEHFGVSRTARYCTLGSEPGETRELWVVLHGYAQLAERFLRWFSPLVDGTTRIIAPEALSRFYLETGLDGRHGESVGATWLTREDRDADLQDHLLYLDGLATHVLATFRRPPPVVVLGFSQGSVMAARWVSRGVFLPDRLVLWGTPLPADVDPAALAARLGTRPVELVAGDRDPFVPQHAIESAAETLRGFGANARAQRFSGAHLIAPLPLLRAAGRPNPSVTS